jgi:methionine-rich copper-binding protein CopC
MPDGEDRHTPVDSIAVEPAARADRSIRHVQSALVARSIAVLVTALLLAFAVTAPVLGHAELDTADPADGAVLDTPPTTITLTFTEGLDASKSSFRVVLDGNDVATGTADEDGSEAMQATGLNLAPGDYVIRWTSVADDGHVERGRTTFTVTEPTPPPASPTPGASEPASLAPSPTAAATPAPTPAPSPSGDPTPAASSGSDVLLPIIAALVIVGVVAYLVLRRGRTA